MTHEGNALNGASRDPPASQVSGKVATHSQSGPVGNVKSVYESDNHYHMVLKNSASTKALTQNGGDSEDANQEFGQEKEFVFKKVDLYRENRDSSQSENY